MELLKTFGVEGKLLIAQLINFFILFFLLKRFAYRPILKMLEKRKNQIETGIRNAEAASQKLKEIEEKEENILRKARKEAQEIIEKTRAQAAKNTERLILAAEKQKAEILQETQAQLEREKRKIISEAKAEIGTLIIQATEKIIEEKIDQKKDEELINKVLKG